jgi:hypothetical protein
MRSTKTIMVVVSFLSFLVFFGCAANDSLLKAPALQQKPEAVSKAGGEEGASEHYAFGGPRICDF